MDTEICGWIIEFILREQVGDNLVKRLLADVPSMPTTDLRFAKTLLLRSIQSEISNNVVSGDILDHLERIQELDRSNGVAEASQSMKDAYCAVAVQSVLQILQGKTDNRDARYFNAVVGICTQRINDMLVGLGEEGLVSEQLRRCKVELEASVWDTEVCQNLLRIYEKIDALKLVTDYVNEECEKMGPSFLRSVVASEQLNMYVATSMARNEGDANPINGKEGFANPVQAKGGDRNGDKPSLMERNSSAFTFGWDDSIDELPDRVVSRRRTRRKTKKWSTEEEDALKKAVQKYGQGNWKIILNTQRKVFEERTEVDLKDKWRNMAKN